MKTERHSLCFAFLSLNRHLRAEAASKFSSVFVNIRGIRVYSQFIWTKMRIKNKVMTDYYKI